MPNVTINASKNAVASATASTFGDARQAEESTSNTINTSSSNIKSVEYFQSSGRGGTTVRFTRSYLAFNFTGYTTNAITNATFKWTSTTTSTAAESCRLVLTHAFGSNTNFNNYVSDSWWESLTMSTSYSSTFSWPDAASNNSVNLNSAAVTFAQSNSYLQFAIVNIIDQSGINPGVNATDNSYGNWSSNNFNINFDYGDSNYPNAVISVAAANIGKVNSIATGDISKVNSVS